jgi:hypothetical protein
MHYYFVLFFFDNEHNANVRLDKYQSMVRSNLVQKLRKVSTPTLYLF